MNIQLVLSADDMIRDQFWKLEFAALLNYSLILCIQQISDEYFKMFSEF